MPHIFILQPVIFKKDVTESSSPILSQNYL